MAELDSSTTNVDEHHNSADVALEHALPELELLPDVESSVPSFLRYSAYYISPSPPFGIRKAMAACAAASFATPNDFHDYHCRFFPFLHCRCATYTLSAKRCMRRQG